MVIRSFTVGRLAILGCCLDDEVARVLASRFKNNSDFLWLAIVVTVFLTVAAQRLDTVPVPQTDEAYTLQVPYEMLNRGRLALPMYRYLGGNIENVWHSYTPLFFVVLSGFFKIFGWSLQQGRAFNLLAATLTLLMTYLVGRRLFGWRVGMIAIVLLISDQTFFERSRLLRNDFAASSFAMLAFYLFEIGEAKKRGGYYIAAGLAAGAAVMCHTNALYMLGAIALLMFLVNGWRGLRKGSFYRFVLAALAVMAYEIVYDIVDYKNFVLQNRDDELHFGLFQRWGWLSNLAAEGKRYWSWAAGSADFAAVPRTTLHVFQLLAVAAIVYLAVFSVRRFKAGDAMRQPTVRLFIVTLVAGLFHAFITSHKEIYYMAHLTPWFALCAGVMLSDGLGALLGRSAPDWLREPRARRAAIVVIAIAVGAFGVQLAREYRGYLAELRDPERASFEEFATVLRDVVPDGVCPVAMKAPVMWLAFPEQDRCFASIEKRMMDNVDLAGKEYVVLLPVNSNKNRIDAAKELNANYPLLAEFSDTPYGDLRVYYTGASSQLRDRPVQRFYFFGRWRGHVSDEQVARGQEIWSRDLTNLAMGADETGLQVDNQGLAVPRDTKSGDGIALWTIDVQPGGIYQLLLQATTTAGRWMIRVVDDSTGATVHQEIVGAQADVQQVEGLFKTGSANRVRLVVQSIGKSTEADPLRISRISICQIPSDVQSARIGGALLKSYR